MTFNLIPGMLKPGAIAFAAMLAVGCSSNYTVDADFPSPLVQPISADVEVQYSEEFSNYVFVEDTEARGEVSVAIGQAQVELFDTMTASMFNGSEDPQRALRITPTIEDFQYAIPRETRAEIYEIWLKYRIQVTTLEDEPIADWLITGYGKTPTAFMKSAQDAIDLAATIALRDVGGQLSIGFGRQPDIKAWLEKTTPNLSTES